jgi:NADP-dependent 3-hydroxy acid dehydrogenase YdfG
LTAQRSAIVTGASRGIGAAIATALGSAGIRTALLARSVDQLERVAARAGNGSFSVECDLTVGSSVDRAISTVRREIGGAPDIIVNNAGLFTIRLLEETSAAELDQLLATNLRAPFRFIRDFLPEMRQRGSGTIVTIGSVADRRIYPGNGVYAATKYGQRAMHEVLREETRGSGVRAALISPAAVDTDIWDPIQFIGTDARPDRSGMLSTDAVADAVLYVISQPPEVNIDELRLSRA